MKIQHVRNDQNQIISTLVAIKNEKLGVVGVGFSVVNLGDKACKKLGVRIAKGRAEKISTKVKEALDYGNYIAKIPKKLEISFREFVTHCQTVNEFRGFVVPSPDNFEYSFERLNNNKRDIFDNLWK